jgi:tetratricopeptide (TPR) repeat protein
MPTPSLIHRQRDAKGAVTLFGQPRTERARSRLEHFGQYDQAGSAFVRASLATSDQTARFSCLRNGADAYRKAKQEAEADALIDEMRADFSAHAEGELQLLEALNDRATALDDTDMRIGVLERMLELDPSNASWRFDLAYQYSKRDDSRSALFHYGSIPELDRTDSVWNNLGVAFSALKLPRLAIHALRAAEEFPTRKQRGKQGDSRPRVL